MASQMAALIRNGFFKEVLTLYSQNSPSFLPKKLAFPLLLKACAALTAAPEAQMLHAQIIKSGFQFRTHTATALTDVYMKLGLVGKAAKLFDEMPEPEIACYNALISGYCRNGVLEKGLETFHLATLRNVRPDSVTVASVLSACAHVDHGLQLHCWANKIGVEVDIYVATSLMTMYFSFCGVNSAERLYGLVQAKSVVFYNAYISGMLQNEAHFQVLDSFNELRGSCSENPNLVTLISAASACAGLKYLGFGRQVHGLISKGKLVFDAKVGTALVDMYSKCGAWESAYRVFKELGSRRNLITWNSMIAGMLFNDQCEFALQLFSQMGDEGLFPDSATWNSMISGFSGAGKAEEAFILFRKMVAEDVVPCPKCITSLLTVCSGLSALRCGQELHGYVIRAGIDGENFTATAVIDLYMKCGKPMLAQNVFEQLRILPWDPAFWNAMISGYGRNGEGEKASMQFDLMMEKKVQPTKATFNCMLSMCSHTAQVDLAWKVFRMMVIDYSLQPTSEQLNIVIDLLARRGMLKEAQDVLQEVTEPSASVFAALLAACKHYADFELGEVMAKKLSALEPDNPFPFVILSNIYAGLEKWENVEILRDTITEQRLRKLAGFSKIAVS